MSTQTHNQASTSGSSPTPEMTNVYSAMTKPPVFLQFHAKQAYNDKEEIQTVHQEVGRAQGDLLSRGDPVKDLFAFLDDLRDSKFFGTLELKFENGKVVIIKKTETIKPGAFPAFTR